MFWWYSESLFRTFEFKKSNSNLHFVPYSSDLLFPLINNCDCNSLMAMWLLGTSTQTEVEADAWKMNLGRLDERKKKEQGQTFAENRKNALFLFSPCSFVLPSQHECRLCCVTMFKTRRHRVAMNHEKLHFLMMSTRDPVSMTCCASSLWLRLAAASSSSHIKRENHCLQVIVHICPLYSQSQSHWLVSKDSKGQEYRSIYSKPLLPQLTSFSVQLSSTESVQVESGIAHVQHTRQQTEREMHLC